MDLSFPPFDRAQELVAWPGDLAVLMVGVAARQGASITAIAHGRLLPAPGIVAGPRGGRFAPADGAFNGAVAALLRGWANP